MKAILTFIDKNEKKNKAILKVDVLSTLRSPYQYSCIITEYHENLCISNSAFSLIYEMDTGMHW